MGEIRLAARSILAPMSDLFEAGGLSEDDAPRPLADRLRPKSLAEVVGQDHLLGLPMVRSAAWWRPGRAHSIILWGPPGTGKTTIARLLSTAFKLHFEQLSAVFSGVADLKKSFEAARDPAQDGAGHAAVHRRNSSLQPQPAGQFPAGGGGRHRHAGRAPPPKTRPSS